jgi:hypothetical protein
MKKVFLLLAATVAALGIGVSASHAVAGGPDTSCSGGSCNGGGGSGCNYYSHNGGYYNYAGYTENAAPPAGGSVRGYVYLASDLLTSPGNHVAAWLGSQDGASPHVHWVQGGISEQYGGSPYLYIEVSGSTVYSAPASYNTWYWVQVNHISGTTWSASVNGVTGFSGGAGFSGAYSSYMGESFDTNTSLCNKYDAYFTQIAPYTTGGMGALITPLESIANVSSTGWESFQY